VTCDEKFNKILNGKWKLVATKESGIEKAFQCEDRELIPTLEQEKVLRKQSQARRRFLNNYGYTKFRCQTA
jgi:hypothetical protein